MKNLIFLSAVVFCLNIFFTISKAEASNQIKWEVVNRFPLLTEIGDFDKYCLNEYDSILSWYQNYFWPNQSEFSSIRERTLWRDGKYDESLFKVGQDAEIKISVLNPPEENCRFHISGVVDLNAACTDVIYVKVPVEVYLSLTIESTSIGTLTKPIRVREKLVFSLGDSFASGEGNPDQPTIHRDRIGLDNNSAYFKDHWIKRYRPEKGPKWWDKQCHRSIYSNHFLASIKYAIERPDTIVKFATWACTGAEINDGLKYPQKNPPGGGKAVKISQIDAAADALRKRNKMGGTTLNSKAKKPDALLLSIGGNDVGFSGVLLYVIAPKKGNPIYKVFRKKGLKVISPGNAHSFIKNDLRERYNKLNILLKNKLAIEDPETIIQVAYPLPLYEEDGTSFCNTFDSIGYSALGEITGTNGRKGWNIKFDESQWSINSVGLPLKKAISQNNKEYGWTIVEGHLNEMIRHGLCATFNHNYAEENIFPSLDKDGNWNLHPTSWNAYKPRARWFRTGNDSYLTQLSCNRTIDVYCAESFYGMVHPSAEGHASIADHVYEKLKKILNQAN